MTIHQRQQDGAEVALQRRAALQVCQYFLRICVTAQFHHNTHTVPIAFIANVCDAANFSVVDRFRQFFDPTRFAQLVGEFRHHDGIAFVASFAWLHLFNVGDAPHWDAAATGQIGLA